MKKLCMIFLLSLFFGCSFVDKISPKDKADIVGTYFLIIDPVSCSVPNTSKVIIEKIDQIYKISAVPINSNKLSFFANANAIKVDGTWKLTIDNKEVGEYGKSKFYENNKSKEDMVIFINAEGISFMGRK
jgi:hypothetical protein